MVPSVASAAVIVGMLWMSNRGLEMIDEGYLLRLTADPAATRPAGDVYLFGFLLHPVYEAVGRDIALFRAVGILVLAVGAALLAREAVAVLRARDLPVSRAHEVSGALVAAASTALVLSFGVMVPAYRSVAVLGSMAAAVGTARVARDQPLRGGLLVGMGTWLCFVGKPTSAIALTACVLILAGTTRLLSWPALAATVGGGLTAAGLTLAVAHLSPADAVDYLAKGAEGTQVLGSHPGLAVLLGIGDPSLQGLVFAPFFVLPLVVARVLQRRGKPGGRAGVDVVTMVALAGAAVFVAALGATLMGPLGTGWQLLSLALLIPLTAVALLARERRASPVRRPAFEVGWLALLLVLPYVNAVGTNLPFGPAMGVASVFWVVALVMVTLGRAAAPGDDGAVARMLSLVVALVVTIVWVVHSSGPEGGDLSTDLRAAPVAGGQLLLHPHDADAAVVLRGAAGAYGITESTPVLDVSGMGAGYALMTGGRPLGRAHHYSYLPHSVEAARRAVATETCADRARAWLLYVPDNGSDLSRAFTGDLLDVSRDYEPVAGFDFVRDGDTWHMQLLRPRPSVAAKLAC